MVIPQSIDDRLAGIAPVAVSARQRERELGFADWPVLVRVCPAPHDPTSIGSLGGQDFEHEVVLREGQQSVLLMLG